MKSPQQAIFDEIMLQCMSVHDEVYMYIPPQQTPLPYVYVGEQIDTDRYTKSGVHGYVTQRVHIYGHIDKRGSTSLLADAIRRKLRGVKSAGGYQVMLDRSNQDVLVDQSTPDPLWHFVIEVRYKYN